MVSMVGPYWSGNAASILPSKGPQKVRRVYVAKDNFKLIKMAQANLIEASLPHLALYSLLSSLKR